MLLASWALSAAEDVVLRPRDGHSFTPCVVAER